MTKKQIHTIEMQEERIFYLTEKLKTLESAYRESWIINKRLQRKIDRLEKNENKLARVNA